MMSHTLYICCWPLSESVQYLVKTPDLPLECHPPNSQVLRRGGLTPLGWEGLGPGLATRAPCWGSQNGALSLGPASSGVWGILGRLCPKM